MSDGSVRMQRFQALRVVYCEHVKPLQFLVDAFVNTFGITRPTARQERLAGLFIGGMLLLIVLLLTGGVLLLRSTLLR